jgi:exo-beta-1,3-glucanase (GH17 family)
MSDTALYYALSTIAQCAAALAALIGFLGLWRLDQLRAEREQAIQMIYRQLNFSQRITGLGIGQEIARLGDEYFSRKLRHTPRSWNGYPVTMRRQG